MIISQTPYRVSFVGGGTDLPAFYREEGGAVLSCAIRRHMYVTVHRRFEKSIRVAYSKTDMAACAANVEHDLVREAMKLAELDEPLEITTIGDVPAGTGMGSSSTLTVGLLNAFHGYRGKVATPEMLGEMACRIEIDILGKPIGRQDQYAAAYGGLNYIKFNCDDTVDVHPVPSRAETIQELEDWAMLMYTAQQRDANQILGKQSAGTRDKISVLREMRDLADELRTTIGSGVESFAKVLHRGWELKRSLGFGISDAWIDDWYAAGRKAGAVGGKLLGAGGGGFMLLLAPPEKHDAVRQALGRPQELPFQVDRSGSRIIFINE